MLLARIWGVPDPAPRRMDPSISRGVGGFFLYDVGMRLMPRMFSSLGPRSSRMRGAPAGTGHEVSGAELVLWQIRSIIVSLCMYGPGAHDYWEFRSFSCGLCRALVAKLADCLTPAGVPRSFKYQVVQWHTFFSLGVLSS